jgi:plastocyanin
LSNRPPLIALAIILVSLVGFAVFLVGTGAGMMGGWMDGWHGRMMGGGGSDPDDAPPVAVTDVAIEDYGFAPASIVIDVGATVTWTNEDPVDHTVTSDGGGVLDSPSLGRGETFRHTFDRPGEYAYYCKPHPNMRGLVTVREGGG